ncbi:MAG: cytochrome c biogenesis protein ResB [Pseudomonadota bacterium]
MKIIQILTKPSLLFYMLPWLMFLLVAGTISQRYIGLFQSEKLFFGSFILWIGIIPTPGAYLTLGIISLSLIARIILKSSLKKHKIGSLITHLSALILLIGGVVTSISREEGYIVSNKNEQSNIVSDYHLRELAIVKNKEIITTIDMQNIRSGTKISEKLPFSINILKYCYNCELKDSELKLIAPDAEDEKNRTGLSFEISGNKYITLQGLEQQAEIKNGNDIYHLIIRQSERPLPFEIKLKKFTKSEHPGTDIARSYSSAVEVIDGAVKFDALIEMNQPLRYRGFTIYQSSFVENGENIYSVLAVVKNSGELFPYIAVICLCIGMAIHIAATLSRKK